MTDEEIKQYIDAQIKEALRSKTLTAGLLPDSDLVRQLAEVELRQATVIQSLPKLFPDLNWKETLSKTYRSLKKKQRQDADSATAELLYLLELDELEDE